MSTQAAAAPAAATAPASGYALAHESSNWLRSHLPSPLSSPKVAVICGSGLSGLAQIVDDEPKCEFAYEDIPNFPSTKGVETRPKFSLRPLLTQDVA